MLSTKLVNAINYQTNLDDSLQQSRHELEHYKQRCATLEAERKTHEDLVTSGALLKKVEVDRTIAKLRAELASERAARDAAEKAKKQTEGELENLTSALFEEANTMVAAARKDTEAVERRNTQLKSQLQDTEMLLANQQEQLQDLKATMERLQTEAPSADPSVPSTPITAHAATFDAMNGSLDLTNGPELPPDHPLHFSQLISPVLRNDISAFNDFQDLLLMARRLGAHSRTSSSQEAQTTNNQAYSRSAASASSPNLPGAFSFTTNSSPSSSLQGTSTASMPPLKESKFYKRVLTEDIEPTLRLDLAPGLSFLSRRTVLGSLLQGSLAVEPYPQNKHYFACTLCGESRRAEPYVRKYRFRTSEDDSVSKPLCDYCVSRLRATCDFVGFLRMVRDGHWRCDSEEDQKSGWEESVRLRERMFWSRLGGGVVPCYQAPKNIDATPSSAVGVRSSRHSLESIPEGPPKIQAPGATHEENAVPERPRSAVGEAIISVSSNAAAPAVPELQPPGQRALDPAFATPPASSGLADEEADPDEAAPAPSTPFEDAEEEPQLSVEAASESEPLSADPNDQLRHELDAETSPREQEAPAQPLSQVTETFQTSAIESREASPSPTRRSFAVAPESSPRTSLSASPPKHERKNSSVLERVRAMEAGRK